MAYIVYPTTTRAKTPGRCRRARNFGLSTWVRGVADQVAAEGFIAMPLISSRAFAAGQAPTSCQATRRRKLIRGVSAAERNRASLPRQASQCRNRRPIRSTRVIGYCWGGQTVFMHAINGGTKGFSGGVAFYGLPYMTPATAESPWSESRLTGENQNP